MKKKILWGIVIILVVMQFIRPDHNTQEAGVVNAQAINQVYQMPENVHAVLKRVCYNCHSNNSEYPWYASVMPVGYWLNHHIEEGKEHLNFDEFGSYDLGKQDKKLKHVESAIQKGWMPLDSYKWMHPEAKMTDAEKESIMSWLAQTRKEIQAKPGYTPPKQNKND